MLASAIGSVVLLATPVFGDWSSLLYSSRGLNGVTLVSDGAGGVVMHWVEREGQIYAPLPLVGLFDAAGNPPATWAYPFYQPPLLNELDIAPDGAAGAIIVTSEMEADLDIRARHVLPDGSPDPAWGPAGVGVCTAVGAQDTPRAASDRSGGAYVCWRDARDGTAALRLSRVLANGSVAAGWPADGLRLATWTAAPVEIRPDGSGGVYVAQLETSARLFRFAGDAQPAAGWPATGLVVATGGTPPYGPRWCVASDAGTFLSWTEGAAVPPPLRPGPVRLLRVTEAGALDPRWAPGGKTVASGAGSFSDPALAPDGTGGVYLAWGVRTADGTRTLRGERLTGAGDVAPGWTPPGNDLAGDGAVIALENTVYEWEDPAVFAVGPDGLGGLMVAWDDCRDPETTQVRVTRFLSGGVRHPAWAEGGRRVSAGSGNGRVRAALGDGSGDALVAWRSITSLPFGSTFLSRVGADVAIAVEPDPRDITLALGLDGANPVSGPLMFVCTLPRAEEARLDLFDLAGRCARSVSVERRVGVQRVTVARPGELPPGILFARLTQGRDQRLIRVALVR